MNVTNSGAAGTVWVITTKTGVGDRRRQLPELVAICPAGIAPRP